MDRPPSIWGCLSWWSSHGQRSESAVNDVGERPEGTRLLLMVAATLLGCASDNGPRHFHVGLVVTGQFVSFRKQEIVGLEEVDVLQLLLLIPQSFIKLLLLLLLLLYRGVTQVEWIRCYPLCVLDDEELL